MKIVMMIFSVLLAFSWNVHAFYIPNSSSTPIVFCDNDSLQVHISRKKDGHKSILMKDITNHHRAPAKLLEENVSELVNKTHTVYTSDEILLKITHDDSGIMPSTLITMKESNPTQTEMTCQYVYQISDSH